MRYVSFKAGVELGTLTTALSFMLWALGTAADVVDCDLQITGGSENRPPGSHRDGRALDVGAARLTDAQLVKLWNCLRSLLPRALFYMQYEKLGASTLAALRAAVPDVVYDNNPLATGPHLHIQVVKTVAFPPAR